MVIPEQAGHFIKEGALYIPRKVGEVVQNLAAPFRKDNYDPTRRQAIVLIGGVTGGFILEASEGFPNVVYAAIAERFPTYEIPYEKSEGRYSYPWIGENLYGREVRTALDKYARVFIRQYGEEEFARRYSGYAPSQLWGMAIENFIQSHPNQSRSYILSWLGQCKGAAVSSKEGAVLTEDRIILGEYFTIYDQAILTTLDNSGFNPYEQYPRFDPNALANINERINAGEIFVAINKGNDPEEWWVRVDFVDWANKRVLVTKQSERGMVGAIKEWNSLGSLRKIQAIDGNQADPIYTGLYNFVDDNLVGAITGKREISQ